MKKYLPLLLLTTAMLACSLPWLSASAPEAAPQEATPASATQAPTMPPAETATTAPELPAGIPISTGNILLTIPDGLASGIKAEKIQRAEGDQVAPWDAAPEHWQLTLENYSLQDRFHTPRIYIYPAQDFLAIRPEMSETLDRLRKISTQAGPLSADDIPGIPFFNAAQMFAAKMQSASFKNGSGVRLVTEYGQGLGSINNHSLFYEFQGLTSDGQFYIIAILPVSSPLLAEVDNPDAAIPAGGIPFDYNDPNFDAMGYYQSMQALLENADPESFSPAITRLDALIASIQINP